MAEPTPIVSGIEAFGNERLQGLKAYPIVSLLREHDSTIPLIRPLIPPCVTTPNARLLGRRPWAEQSGHGARHRSLGKGGTRWSSRGFYGPLNDANRNGWKIPRRPLSLTICASPPMRFRRPCRSLARVCLSIRSRYGGCWRAEGEFISLHLYKPMLISPNVDGAL